MDVSEKLEALKNDEKFIAKLNNVKTMDDFINTFADEGIDVTADEVIAIANLFNDDGELDIAALDMVSGGSVIGGIVAFALICAGASALKGFFDGVKCKKK